MMYQVTFRGLSKTVSLQLYYDYIINTHCKYKDGNKLGKRKQKAMLEKYIYKPTPSKVSHIIIDEWKDKQCTKLPTED